MHNSSDDLQHAADTMIALLELIQKWSTPGTPEYVVRSFFVPQYDPNNQPYIPTTTLWAYEPFVIEAEKRMWVTLTPVHYSEEGRSVWASLTQLGKFEFAKMLTTLLQLNPEF